jgi:ferric-dicitrate binding protein FerR (iron transport regulator)
MTGRTLAWGRCVTPSQITRRDLLGAAASGLIAGRAQAGTQAGVVESARGNGYAKLDAVRRLSPGAGIFIDELVWTEAQSRLVLALEGGAKVFLGARTSLRIDRFVAGSETDLAMGDGALVFDRPEDVPKAEVAVRSVFGLISVRGTRFFAGPSGDAPFAVFCERGAVNVRNRGIGRVLGPGDGVDIPAPNQPPGPVRKWGAGRIQAAFASVL